jgi:hypothetical protein
LFCQFGLIIFQKYNTQTNKPTANQLIFHYSKDHKRTKTEKLKTTSLKLRHVKKAESGQITNFIVKQFTQPKDLLISLSECWWGEEHLLTWDQSIK